jgi:hypothetical protein
MPVAAARQKDWADFEPAGARARESPGRTAGGTSPSAPRRNRGHDLSNVIRHERAPCLRRRPPVADHVFRDGGLRDVNAQFHQFAMDPRRTPERIRLRHGPNQRAHSGRYGRPPGTPTALPRPNNAAALW